MKPYRRVVIIVMWVLALVEAVREGWSVPDMFPGGAGGPLHTLRDWNSLRTFNWNIVWFGLFVSPVMMLVLRALSFPFLRRRSSGRFRLWVDRRFGAGTMAWLTGAVRSKALIAAVASVMGTSAVLACEQKQGSAMAFHISMFVLAAGIGTAMAYLLESYLDKRKSAPDSPVISAPP